MESDTHSLTTLGSPGHPGPGNAGYAYGGKGYYGRVAPGSSLAATATTPGKAGDDDNDAAAVPRKEACFVNRCYLHPRQSTDDETEPFEPPTPQSEHRDDFRTTVKDREAARDQATAAAAPATARLWRELTTAAQTKTPDAGTNRTDLLRGIAVVVVAIALFAAAVGVPLTGVLVALAAAAAAVSALAAKGAPVAGDAGGATSSSPALPKPTAADIIREHFGIRQGTPIYIDDYDCVCQAPSADNPCMNVLPFDDPFRPKACDPMVPEIQRRMDEYFYANPAFVNPRDIFGLHNDLHQWVPLPGQTIPADREAWMRDAYRGMCSCKDRADPRSRNFCAARVSWDVRRP